MTAPLNTEKALFMKRARLTRLERKEIPELTRLRDELGRFAARGSVADEKNLAFVSDGLNRANREAVKLRGDIAKLEGNLGSVWIRKADALDKEASA